MFKHLKDELIDKCCNPYGLCQPVEPENFKPQRGIPRDGIIVTLCITIIIVALIVLIIMRGRQ